MKKIIGLMTLMFGLAFAFFFTGVSLTSCENAPKKEQQTQLEANQFSANLVFDDATQAMLFQADLLESETIKNVFVGMNPNVLKQVAAVLQSKGVPLSVRQIITEYQAHQDIYDNLDIQEDPGPIDEDPIPIDADGEKKIPDTTQIE